MSHLLRGNRQSANQVPLKDIERIHRVGTGFDVQLITHDGSMVLLYISIYANMTGVCFARIHGTPYIYIYISIIYIYNYIYIAAPWIRHG